MCSETLFQALVNWLKRVKTLFFNPLDIWEISTFATIFSLTIDFMQRTPTHLFLTLSTLTFLLFSACKNYDGGDPLPSCTNVHWEYEGVDGPDAWAYLCVDYTPCGGIVQSPIDIAGTTDDATLSAIPQTYIASATHIVNNGHTVQFNSDAGSSIIVNGEAYQLLQFHSHTHSEHTVNGTAYPLELHFVHKNSTTGKLAVIGVFFKEGAENAALKPLLEHLPTASGGTYDSADTYNVASFFPSGKSYFTYQGSLTTPPCSEIVTWTVMETAVEASHEQIKKFEDIEHENARPTQPIYGRTIRHFKG